MEKSPAEAGGRASPIWTAARSAPAGERRTKNAAARAAQVGVFTYRYFLAKKRADAGPVADRDNSMRRIGWPNRGNNRVNRVGGIR